jgi:hypothetical protein
MANGSLTSRRPTGKYGGRHPSGSVVFRYLTNMSAAALQSTDLIFHSGPKRFEYDAGNKVWLGTRDRQPLNALLCTEIEETTGLVVEDLE